MQDGEDGGRAPAEALLAALVDPLRPTFLFGAVPPREGTSLEAAADIGEKFVARSRALATDGFIVYDIQDEAGRTEDPRPFPFKKTLDPSEFGSLLQRRSGKGTVVYKCVVEHGEGAFDEWLDDAISRHNHRCLNLVGGAASSVQYSGPTLDEAAQMVTARRAAFGCVTIAERHVKKGTEHQNLLRKAELGAQWFISQARLREEPTAAAPGGSEGFTRGRLPDRPSTTRRPRSASSMSTGLCAGTRTWHRPRLSSPSRPAAVRRRCASSGG